MKENYYVIKKDNVVQEAKNFVDYLVLKLGLEKVVNFFESLIKNLINQVSTLRQLEEARKFLGNVLLKIVVFLDHLQLGKVRQ